MNMKVNERLILTFINKYKDDDPIFLCRELQIQKTMYDNAIQTLYDNELIILNENRYQVTEKGKKQVFENLNKYVNKEHVDEKEIFEWKELHIPKNMIKY